MISVCMATYNGVRFIKEQIESILSQLSENDELIISDDGSTDGTLDIIQEFDDIRIKVYFHQTDRTILSLPFGNYSIVAKNFENSLQHAKGDYIFMSDQDDLWEENRVKNCMKDLSNNLLVMTNYKVIDGEGMYENKIGYNFSPIFNNIMLNVIRSRFMCCCLAFRRELLNYALPFPHDIESCEQWLGNIAVKYGTVKFLKETYHLYRRHGSNVSETTEKSKNSLKLRIMFRLKLLWQLRKRFWETSR